MSREDFNQTCSSIAEHQPVSQKDVPLILRCARYHIIDQKSEFELDVIKVAVREFAAREMQYWMSDALVRAAIAQLAKERDRVEAMVKDTMGQKWFDERYNKERPNRGDEIDQIREKEKQN